MSDPMPTSQKRRPASPVRGFVKALEAVGVLNKGSADSPATPLTDEAAKTTGVNTNSLNVTRVGGFASTIAAVGAAALAIFNVDKAKDAPSIVVAAYISVGAIIAAALVTVAIIINADIRSRVTVETTARQTESQTEQSASFIEAWRRALDLMSSVIARLQRRPEEPFDAWLDASASFGPAMQLKPSKDQQGVHALLQAGHSRILSKLEHLIDEKDARKREDSLIQVREWLDSMERCLRV
jgi:hypothetical protein